MKANPLNQIGEASRYVDTKHWHGTVFIDVA